MRWMAMLLCSGVAGAQALQANLAKPLNLDSLKQGGHFALVADNPWAGAGCKVEPRAEMRVDVLGVTKNAKGHVETAELAVAAPCGTAHPVRLVLTALLAPEETESIGAGYNKSSSFSAPPGTGGDMSGRANPSMPLNNETTVKEHRPTAVRVGQVWGFGGVTLALPDNEGKGFRISTVQPLKMPAGTTFVLQAPESVRQ